MTDTICRYLATPSTVFEAITEVNQKTFTVQKFAIVRLAQCIQVNLKIWNEFTCYLFPHIDQARRRNASSC